MIAELRSGVAQGLLGAPGMRGDEGNERGYSLWRGCRRMEEGVESEGPGQNAQRRFLAADPERAGHRRITGGPVLDGLPEDFRELLVAGEGIGSSERIDE